MTSSRLASFVETWRRRLAHRNAVPVIVAVSFVLSLAVLSVPPMMDDLVHRFVLEGHRLPGGPRSFLDLYRFTDGGPGLAECIERGLDPWWTSRSLRLSFFRPLSSAWLAFDHFVLRDTNVLVHLEGCLLHAALVVVVARLYGRLLGGATAVLATLFFALDDAQVLPILWAANRYALLAAALGAGALVVHVARGSRVLSAALLASSLLAGESGLGTVAYLVAYALFADDRGPKKGLERLAPYGLVLVPWATAYVMLGYGVRGSQGYVDPAGSPLRFTITAAERLPQLLLGQLFGPPAELWALAPPGMRLTGILVTVTGTALLGFAILRATRGHPLRAFLAVGTVLSALPPCATIAADRNLLFPSLGAFGLIAIAVARAARALRGPVRPLPSQIGALAWIAFAGFHAPFAALLFQARTWTTGALFIDPVRRGAATIPRDATKLLILVAPDALMTSYMGLEQFFDGGPLRERVRLLGVAQRGRITVTRPTKGRLVFRATEGMYSDTFSPLFRETPFRAGETFRVREMTATVREVDATSGVREATFDFTEGLEDATWITWKGMGFETVPILGVGESLELAGTTWQEQGTR